MGQIAGIIFCLAYIMGLLSTSVAWGGFFLLAVAIALALGLPYCWRRSPRPWVWVVAGVLSVAASFYLQARQPQAISTDISRLISETGRPAEWVIWGKVESLPRLTRSQKSQFWLRVQQVAPSADNRPVTGKLYVTVPLLQGTGLRPGQRVNVTGNLYRPQPATNPGGFDFRAYLQQQGSFAGLRGRQVVILQSSDRWGWWQVQQRILRSQMAGLGSPAGPLLSAMVLGSRPVDLPYDLKDAFIAVGLAAALAASGFQTSLILGVVLSLTGRFSTRIQVAAGTIALLFFVGLTGLQPAVLRAAVMGFGGLVALLLKRQVKPLGALLLTAVFLLIWNPLWIWDLGFQLSFLATLGLIVTVPPLTRWLDWMPTAIAPLVAVPIAAYLWTLPLQLVAFGVVSPYSIPVNIVTTPLISVMSIGGMVSALAALVWSPAGSALAWVLLLPTQALITLVQVASQLWGSSYATGTISLLVAIGLYGLLVLATWQPWWQKRWWLALMLGVGLTLVPTWQARASEFQVTLLAGANPALVVQDRGRVAVFNASDEATVRFSLLPFLQKAGVNQVNWAIALPASGPQLGWTALSQRLPIQGFYQAGDQLSGTAALPSGKVLPLTGDRPTQLGALQVQQRHSALATLEWQWRDQTWLWLGNASLGQQADLLKTADLHAVQVLCWNGKRLHPELLELLRPQVAIATAKTLDARTQEQLRSAGVRLYWTGRDGAVQWNPREGFKTTLDPGENRATNL